MAQYLPIDPDNNTEPFCLGARVRVHGELRKLIILLFYNQMEKECIMILYTQNCKKKKC